MQWLPYLSYFFAGAFAANAVPHYVNGISGRAFQSPFAKPPGQGLSSSIINVLWGTFNAAIAWLLTFRVGDFNPYSGTHMLLVGMGAFLMSLMLANSFGKFHGGNSP